MNSDRGRRMDEDSISNRSGDTWLLHDIDENSSEIDIHAARASRALRDEPAVNTVSSENNSNTRYIGADRFLTDFEKKHFHPDNITPEHPCTIYVSSYDFTDSKAVFNALADQNLPLNSIRCLQRRPAGGMLTTSLSESKLRY